MWEEEEEETPGGGGVGERDVGGVAGEGKEEDVGDGPTGEGGSGDFRAVSSSVSWPSP